MRLVAVARIEDHIRDRRTRAQQPGCIPGPLDQLQLAARQAHGPPRWEVTDWQQISDLYDALIQVWPSPVVALNRAIAIGEARGPQAGLAALDRLATEPQLAGYHYLPAARAAFLRRLHRTDDAQIAYHEARLLAYNPVEREFLTRRISELDA